jgi:hypothetical protein
LADNVTATSTSPAGLPNSTVIATDQVNGSEHVQFIKIMDGTLNSTNKLAVSAAGEASVAVSGVAAVGGNTVRVVTSFTRPADTTPYTIGDAIMDNTVAGSATLQKFDNLVRTANGTGYITKLKLHTNTVVSVSLPQIRLHLFSAAVTVQQGDNAAAVIKHADRASYLGYIDLAAAVAAAGGTSDTSVAFDATLRFAVQGDATQDVYFLPEARTGFTPINAQTFEFTATCEQN